MLGKIDVLLAGLLVTVFSLCLIVPNLVFRAHRLHDINQTGWLILVEFALDILLGLGIILYTVIGLRTSVDLVTGTTIKII